VTARLALNRFSKIQRLMIQEYAGARTIGVDSQSADRHMLVVGNSLLNEGVDFDAVQRALAGWDTRRFVVEQTFFYDWYYGLKHLYREGARPDVVVLMLSVGQWMPAAIRGDYSAQYLFSAEDLPEVARDLHMNATQTADLLASNLSKFWGARAEMRNFVIARTIPDLGRLMQATQTISRRPLVDEEVQTTVAPRIERIKRLTDEHRTELVLLVPPLLDPSDGADGLMRAADRAGVPVLRPVVSGTFGAHLFRDGMHLTPTGAEMFTEQLIGSLKSELTLRPGERRAMASLEPRGQ